MSQPSYYVNPRPASDGMNPWILRTILLMGTGFLLLFFTLLILLAGYQFMTQDQIYPGVSSIYGIDIGGMTRAEAIAALRSQPNYGDEAVFVFQYGDQQWEYTGEELGIRFDVEATVDTAYSVGRDETWLENLTDQFSAWRNGVPVAPVIQYNQTQAETIIRSLSEDYINQPVMDATLILQNGQVISTPSQIGLQVNIDQTMQLLQQEILAMNTRSTIQLNVEVAQPALASAEEAADKVRLALNEEGVRFFIPTEYGITAGPWIAKPVSIENMIRIERVDNPDGTAYYDVYVITDHAREFLAGLKEELDRKPQNSRFIFNDSTRQLEVIESSINGLGLNIDETLRLFPQAVFSADDRSVPLVFDEVVPTINDNATAAELGITELVVEATTYYYGSTSARQANIKVAAERFHGIVIPPGGEFSFNEWLGEVSTDEGFEEGLIIVGGQTITGVGGGVCQVSSTAFQAAFYAGFPILERYPHGYRVGYYEAGEGPGMDATVYSPVVDFRFVNDTPYHLLIETYVRPGNSTVTFKFYSTSMGRRVEKEGPIIKNEKAAPPPIYHADPSLSPGEIFQTDYAVSGAEVFVYRTVYQGDEILIDREEFYSNYIPWPAQFNVSPSDGRVNG
jgi:vancomycin resistance protein YoaR